MASGHSSRGQRRSLVYEWTDCLAHDSRCILHPPEGRLGHVPDTARKPPLGDTGWPDGNSVVEHNGCFWRSLSEQLGPLTAAAGVYAVAAVVVLISMLSGRQGRRTWRSLDRKYLYGCGTLFVSYMVFLYLGLGLADNRLQVLEVGLLNYLWPILTLLFSVLLLRKKPHWLLLPATVLALIGIVLVVVPHAATPGPGGWWQAAHEALLQHPLPLWLGLAAAVTWASYSTLTGAGQPGRPVGECTCSCWRRSRYSCRSACWPTSRVNGVSAAFRKSRFRGLQPMQRTGCGTWRCAREILFWLPPRRT